MMHRRSLMRPAGSLRMDMQSMPMELRSLKLRVLMHRQRLPMRRVSLTS